MYSARSGKWYLQICMPRPEIFIRWLSIYQVEYNDSWSFSFPMIIKSEYHARYSDYFLLKHRKNIVKTVTSHGLINTISLTIESLNWNHQLQNWMKCVAFSSSLILIFIFDSLLQRFSFDLIIKILFEMNWKW